jgi:uncharacterized protein with HEPN domain
VVDDTAGLTYEAYAGDRATRQAVERSFEIIGEAMRRIERHDPETAALFPEARELIGLRNVLLHAYDGIDHAQVWLAITAQLPALLARVEEMIAVIDAEGARPAMRPGPLASVRDRNGYPCSPNGCGPLAIGTPTMLPHSVQEPS